MSKSKNKKRNNILKSNIRKYVAKYFEKRLKREGIKKSSDEFKNRINTLYYNFKEIKNNGNDVSDYKTTVKNVLFWYRQYYPYKKKKKQDKNIPPAPILLDAFKEGLPYWEMHDVTALLNSFPKYLSIYSETVFTGYIQAGNNEEFYETFDEYITDIISELNQLQQEISQNSDYNYETDDVNYALRWRRSKNGKRENCNDAYWNKNRQEYELELMLVDAYGNKLFLADLSLASFNKKDGSIIGNYNPELTDVEQLADELINVKKGIKSKPPKEIKEEVIKAEEPKYNNIENDKINAEKEIKLKELENKKLIDLEKLKTKEKIKLQELADIKDLFSNGKITFKEYREAQKEINEDL